MGAESRRAGEEGKVSNIVIPTTNDASFRGFNIAHEITDK
jgi:hypothetical protein